mgnify:CR=1 FL=1
MLEALFLGIVQGLTEFLPISSSAHIRIVGAFMPNANDPGAAFTAITQIGTELAVLIYFRKDILTILRSWFKRDGSAEARLGTLIIIGTLPIIVLGYLGQDYITNNFRSLWLIASTLIIFGLILGFADRFGRSRATHAGNQPPERAKRRPTCRTGQNPRRRSAPHFRCAFLHLMPQAASACTCHANARPQSAAARVFLF